MKEATPQSQDAEREAPGWQSDARDILSTIDLALKRGYAPSDVLDENSPIRDRIRASLAAASAPVPAEPSKDERSLRMVFNHWNEFGPEHGFGELMDRLQSGSEPQPMPNPGSPIASAMMDSVLAEYQWPSNPKNAARAGYVAACRLMASPVPASPVSAPEAARVYLVATGEVVNGQETYTRHDYKPPLSDAELVWTCPPATRSEWQRKATEHGFKYWRAPDAHGVSGTPEQALALLEDLLGVEVDMDPYPTASTPVDAAPAGEPTPEQIADLSLQFCNLEPLSDFDYFGFARAVLARYTAPAAILRDAIRDVMVERERQVNVEGWTPRHDDEHDKGEIAVAAALYALRRRADPTLWVTSGSHPGGASRFLEGIEGWIKPCDQRRSLVKAGALILAEIERLDRADAQRLGREKD